VSKVCQGREGAETVGWDEPSFGESHLVLTADGRVYFISAEKSHVIKAGPKFEILATNSLGGSRNGSSPAISGGRIFLRDDQNLYCIGKK